MFRTCWGEADASPSLYRLLNLHTLKLITFLLFLLPLQAFAQDSIARSDAWQIIQAVHDTIAARHPFSFIGDNRARLKAGLADIRPQLDLLLASRPGDSLTYPDVIGLASPLQEVTECGHTMLRRKVSPGLKAALAEQRTTVRVIRVEDGRYVLLAPVAVGTDTLAKGLEVAAFEGRPLHELVSGLGVFYGVNDHSYQEGTNLIISRALDYYYQVAYGVQDTVSLTVRQAGKPLVYQVPLLRAPPKIAEKGKKKRKAKRTEMKIGFNEERTVAYLSVPTFRSDGFNRKEVRAAIREVNDAGVDKLIIDVRGNLGGSLGNTYFLYRLLAKQPFVRFESFESYSPDAKPTKFWYGVGERLAFGMQRDGDRYHRPRLKKPKKPLPKSQRFTGDLVVMINKTTFSAASLFGHYVQSNGRGELVGTVSGGSTLYSYGGRKTTYPIGPNGELFLRMMNYRLALPNPGAGNLTPDYLLPVTLEMILTAGDDRRHFAEELLINKR